MAQPDRYEILSNAFSNPTKMGIIMLIVENGKMTVTSMAKFLDVSRSNLYHFVAQMVSDGILNEPEVVPKKNYVEKYYTLNREMFGSVDSEEWVRRISNMEPARIRTMLGSALMSYSMSLKLAADQIYQSSDEEAENIKKWLMTKPAWLSYSALGKTTSSRVEKSLNSLLKTLQESESNQGENQEDETSRLMIVFLPLLKGKFISKLQEKD